MASAVHRVVSFLPLASADKEKKKVLLEKDYENLFSQPSEVLEERREAKGFSISADALCSLEG